MDDGIFSGLRKEEIDRATEDMYEAVLDIEEKEDIEY